MTLLKLTALCLCIVAIDLDVVGTSMCDDGWVHHSSSNTCLQIVSESVHRQVFRRMNTCRHHRGGQYHNISGNVVEFTEEIAPFLRDYLQFMNVPGAAVRVKYLLRHVFVNYYTSPPRPENEELLTYFVPGKPFPFKNPLSFYGDSTVICEVLAGPVEPPACPRDVKFASAADRNVTLSWSPGQLGRHVVVNVKVQTCDDVGLSCEDSANRTFRDVSIFQPRNYTVTELQPKTKYMFVMQILNDKYETTDCNVTLALSTNEETDIPVAMSRTEEGQDLSGTVIGLSVALVISLSISVVLAILQLRHVRQAKKGRDRATRNIVSNVTKSKAAGQEIKLEVHKNPKTDSGMYGNVQEKQHAYDETVASDDEHIYEES